MDATRNPEGVGNLHHIAFTVSRATYTQIAQRLDEQVGRHAGEVNSGFMDSLYFHDPLGQLMSVRPTSLSRRQAARTPTSSAKHTCSTWRAATITLPTNTWPTPSSC